MAACLTKQMREDPVSHYAMGMALGLSVFGVSLCCYKLTRGVMRRSAHWQREVVFNSGEDNSVPLPPKKEEPSCDELPSYNSVV